MHVSEATDQRQWDDFLSRQRFRPFLQSWTMGEVYRDIGETPVRLTLGDESGIRGVCQGIVVPARRGRHLAVLYGPVLDDGARDSMPELAEALKAVARDHRCRFIRCSPFWVQPSQADSRIPDVPGARPSPLHLLAEHVWYLPLTTRDTWQSFSGLSAPSSPRTEDDILMSMRKTTRNLIRRAEREGVTVTASSEPERDIELFLRLHDETRRRHSFTPYTNAFFRAQLLRFAERGEATLYLARYEGDVIASSIHMHAAGETSYHHGASSAAHAKIPASPLLQWTAIKDAMARNDHMYNFWGIAPLRGDPASAIPEPGHPFAGVTTFKRGFGGSLLELVHCMDIPLHPMYTVTSAFETFRKWKRGF